MDEPLPAPLWSQASPRLPRLPVEWLQGLLREGAAECPWIEFKANLADPVTLARYVSALANGAALADQPHGYQIWGIDDASRTWVGTTFRPEEAKKGNEDLRFWLAVTFRGQVEPEFFEVQAEDRRAVVMRVPAAVGRPVTYAGEAWLRVQSSTVRLRDFAEQDRALRGRLDRTRFEQGVALEGCTPAQVFEALDTDAFFRLAMEPAPQSAHERLSKLADWACVSPRLDGRWNVLNLGALLVARRLRPLDGLGRKALRVVLYRGHDASAQSEELPLGERGYALTVDEAVHALTLRLPAEERMHGAQRERYEHFPSLSLRELIVNALVHQDLSVRGAGPIVEAFDNRLEITNPGRPLVALNRLIDWPAQSRNEALARAMRMLRFCEERGSGIDRVVARAEAFSLPAPAFEVLEGRDGGADFMRVRLLGPLPFGRLSTDDRLRAVYQHACLLYQRGQRMTNASLRERFALGAEQMAQVSRLIAAARAQQLIRTADDSERAYVPGWVGRPDAPQEPAS